MRLTLVPLDSVPVPLVKKVAARLRHIVPWTIKTSSPLICQLCGNQQEQVDAREVLLLLPEGERHNMLTVGITDDDLTVPGLDFVYGHAMPERRAGVVSLHRLRPTRVARQQVLLDRACKEVLHEMGHVLDLVHCQDSTCVMHYSQTLHDTDAKRCCFCPKCLIELSRMPENVDRSR